MAVAAPRQVHMDVIFVIPIGTGAEHRGEPPARALLQAHAKFLGYAWIGQPNQLAVGEPDGADVKRVGLAVLGQNGSCDAVAPTAVVGSVIVDALDGRLEKARCRRKILAHPVDNGLRKLAAHDGGRGDRNTAAVREQHGFQTDRVLRAACAGAFDGRHRRSACKVGRQSQPAGRRRGRLSRRCGFRRLRGRRLSLREKWQCLCGGAPTQRQEQHQDSRDRCERKHERHINGTLRPNGDATGPGATDPRRRAP